MIGSIEYMCVCVPGNKVIGSVEYSSSASVCNYHDNVIDQILIVILLTDQSGQLEGLKVTAHF